MLVAADAAVTILSAIKRDASSYLDHVNFNPRRYLKVKEHYNVHANESWKRAQETHDAAVEAARREHPDRICSTGSGDWREV